MIWRFVLFQDVFNVVLILHFAYIDVRVSAGGGCEADVMVRTDYGWQNFI